MKRCDNIYNHPLYRNALAVTESAEKTRRFCRHGIRHSLDTARIGYIYALENGLPIKKDVIYAAALLHDCVKYRDGEKVEAHEAQSAELSKKILPDCGFTQEETLEISEAIRSHRNPSSESVLCRVLHIADRLSRRCYDCEVSRECYWSEDKKNKSIEY